MQDATISAAEGQEVVALTRETLQRIRNDENSKLFWSPVEIEADKHDAEDPIIP